MLFFLALSALAAATFGSVVMYQRGERRRIEGGADPRLLLAAATDDDGANDGKKNKKSTTTPPRKPSEDPTLATLDLGDIVVDGADDWVVVGTVRYREEGDRWQLHVLDGGQRRRYFEVRTRNGELEAAFVDVADGLPGGQLAQGLNFHGTPYQLDVRGDARTTVTGEVDVGVTTSGGQLAYARYSGPGGALLLVEDEGAAPRRAFVGSRVTASSLTLMSGELNRQG